MHKNCATSCMKKNNTRASKKLSGYGFLTLGLCIPFLMVTNGFGQFNEISLPTIIPPSPEVSQLANIGKASVGLHSGSANANIELCKILSNNTAINIALIYSSNGIKIDDIPGRAGLGWNLVAGGVVSRVVHGEPDGDIVMLTPPLNLYAKDQTMYDYLNTVTNPQGGYDTEWDEY